MVLHVVVLIVLALCSLAVAYQDFKERLISVWLIVLFAAANVSHAFFSMGWEQLVENVVFVVMYLLFSYLVLLLYFFIKSKRLGGILDEMIGWGDVWLMLAIGVALEPAVLLVFFTVCFLLAVVVQVLWIKGRVVPLAGVMVLGYVGWVLVGYGCVFTQ